MSGPDVVIPVRPGEQNEELRYALRSIDRFLPGPGVWLAGHAPTWTSVRAGRIPSAQRSDKYRNALNNLLTACRDPRVSGSFTLWQDDVFILRPPDAGLPVLHRGPMEADIQRLVDVGSKWYLRMLVNTSVSLEKLGIPLERQLSYEVHAPCPAMLKDRVLWLHARPEVTGHKGLYAVRSLYYNYWGPRGVLAQDPKVRKSEAWAPGPLYASTSDKTFADHEVGDHVRALLPGPCRFERS